MFRLEVYAAKFYKDKPQCGIYRLLEWVVPIQAGMALTQERVADVLDNNGENISCMNANYCELTALYWIWKNRLVDAGDDTGRYIRDKAWEAVLQVIKELAPGYYKVCGKIFGQEYFYSYNILIARAGGLKRYCEWLLPLLERVEEPSVPKESERGDRYIGYIGENLLTRYFMYHSETLKIVHTGRLMLT